MPTPIWQKATEIKDQVEARVDAALDTTQKSGKTWIVVSVVAAVIVLAWILG